MFKRLIFLLGMIILPVLLLLIFLNLWFTETSPQPAIVVAIEAEAARIEAELVAQEATSQAELERLVEALQQQHTGNETKRATLNAQIITTQEQLVELQLKKQDLQSQLARLETVRAERQAAHQNQLRLVRSQYESRLTPLQIQLAEIQAKLSQVQP